MVQEFSHEKFFFHDISFILEMSRKRAISPYAIVVALIYMNRIKTKTKSSPIYGQSANFDKYAASYLSNTELCLVSLVRIFKILYVILKYLVTI